jgi:Uma2 family endonuclease
MATDIRIDPVVYPDSDGKPMAESDVHIDLVIDLRSRLKARYAGDPNVYVAGNLLVYYVEGEPRVSLAPDGFVVFGVPNRRRRSYKTWVEGRFPDVVFEFTSASTQEQDLGDKFDIYQDVWRVKEYFLFDPLDEYLDPPLLGYRMSRGELRPIRPGKGVVSSKVLGVTLGRDGTRLVLRDTATGAELLTPEEQRAAAAEAEVARLKAEIAALRRKPTK